ncbi:hypothetical protein [Fodinicola acaciae]|uniref:hypothetical protein n=1 Tax=Fodinicola acaciae TaxID=2681555 RepID=UPI0013D822AC|nr:hypothetical protein [Fodinicola acaciae]
MTGPPTHLRLVARRRAVAPLQSLAAGAAFYALLQAYSADYSTIVGPVALIAAVVLVVLALGLAGFAVFLPRPVVTVESRGVRAKAPFAAELRIGWAGVHGFRVVRTFSGSLLVFDISPEFWFVPGVKRWVGRGPYANAITIVPAGMDVATAFAATAELAPETVARATAPAPSVWTRALFAGLLAFVCGLLFAAQPALGLSVRKPPAQQPAGIAANPCTRLSARTLRTAVPAAGGVVSTGRQQLSDSVKWTCGVSSESEQPYGELNISVTRLGSAFQLSAERRAQEQYVNYRNSYLVDLTSDGRAMVVTGLGDEAIGIVRNSYVHIFVRRGADLVDVRYTASPSTVDRMLATSAAIVGEVLAGLLR